MKMIRFYHICAALLKMSLLNVANSVNHMCVGAQWLSGRVLDLRPRGQGFEPHRRHCIVVLKQDTFILA